MSNDEHLDSLAAQAAAWVPPWERPRSEPDRDYRAAHRAGGRFDDEAGEGDDVVPPDDDEDRSSAGLSDDDDDFDEAFEGGNPPGYEVSEPAPEETFDEPPERPGGATVDDPRELPGEGSPEPTEVHLGAEVPLPESISDAAGADEDEGGVPVDAPLPADGDDAGDVFDLAADDDVSDDGEVDLPFSEVIPADDNDDEAALAADDAPFRRGSGSDGSADLPGAGLADDGGVDSGSGPNGHEWVAGDSVPDGHRPVGSDSGPDGHERVGGGNEPDGHESARLESGSDGEQDSAGRNDELGDEASAYAAGAADAVDALRGAAGQHAVNGHDPHRDQLTTQPPAESIGDAGRAEAGSAVPVQGRRRRDGGTASGDAVRRTSEGGEAGSEAATETVTSALPALENDAELAGALEAIMLVVDEPVGELQLAEILEQPPERIARIMDDLSAGYTAAGHGFDLRRAAGGWRLYTRPEYAGYVERFVLDGQSVRLTQAALETLAVVAYKQPVTRSRISAIRGVNCDGVMRTLVTRGLIEECGTERETGAYLYRTTALFLEKLGLNAVDQLPPLAPFLPDDVEEVLDASG